VTSTDYTDALNRHYGRQGLVARITTALRAMGKDMTSLAVEDLAPVDQFHVGGRDATLGLARLAEIRPEDRVLDVGGGLGGAARTLASGIGCHVTVLDLTEEFCRAGAELTRHTGLADRVSFQHASAVDMPFDAERFDVAWTQHSSMNIEDKPRLYAEIHRVLRPGGRLAIHEIVQGRVTPFHLPVPWAREGTLSFLAEPGAMRAGIAAAGFEERVWTDVSAASLAWFRRRVDAVSQRPSPLGLQLVLGVDVRPMMANLVRNLEEDRIAIVEGVWRRA
jgi:ubiquinone/menaquinone biosynthesis C-methylase UbiE